MIYAGDEIQEVKPGIDRSVPGRDATGLALCPGFMDMHSHSDLTLWVDPRGLSKISQGITTEVIGQCGTSGAPLYGPMVGEVGRYFAHYGQELPYASMAAYLEGLDEKVSPNLVALIGHGTLRRGFLGEVDRQPTETELNDMKNAVVQSMREGAFGLSTGLIYPPGCYTETAELVSLSEAMAPFGGIYFSHIRSEGDKLIEAVAETLYIGEVAGVAVQLSHHKAMGAPNWGKTETTLAMVTAAKEKGLDVSLDQYPYTASATNLASLLPDWALVGGKEEALKRIQDPVLRAKMRYEIEEKEEAFGWSATRISSVVDSVYSSWQGKTLEEVAATLAIAPIEALFYVLEKTGLQVGMIRFGMDETEVQKVLSYAHTLIGTDGGAVAPDGPLSMGMPHPRGYGTFPRILGHYVREEALLSLPSAIARMTGMAAKRLRLHDRGFLKPGQKADLVLFDPNTVGDRASFDAPHQFAVGIYGVYVNGEMVWQEGKYTGLTPGRALRRP